MATVVIYTRMNLFGYSVISLHMIEKPIGDNILGAKSGNMEEGTNRRAIPEVDVSSRVLSIDSIHSTRRLWVTGPPFYDCCHSQRTVDRPQEIIDIPFVCPVDGCGRALSGLNGVTDEDPSTRERIRPVDTWKIRFV